MILGQSREAWGDGEAVDLRVGAAAAHETDRRLPCPIRRVPAPHCGHVALAETSLRRLRQGSDALDARGRLAAKRVRHHGAAFPQVHDQSSLMPLSARSPIIEVRSTAKPFSDECSEPLF